MSSNQTFAHDNNEQKSDPRNDIKKEEIAEKYEETVRAMISREDELTNHRMTWMAAFNGLLFAALGFVWQQPGEKTYLKDVFSWNFVNFSIFFWNTVCLTCTKKAAIVVAEPKTF